MANILVTGGAGYIGTNTVFQLINRGHNVTVVDNLFRGFKDEIHDKTTFYQTDLTNYEDIEFVFRKEKIDIVLHLASLAYVKESVESPEMYLEKNVKMTKNILDLCSKYEVNKIIFSSSCTVYGNENGNKLLDEADNLMPINPYGQSKLICEDLIKNANLNYIILRLFNVAGADVKNKMGLRVGSPSYLLHVLSKSCIQNKIVRVNGRGECIRDYIHVSEIAEINQLCVLYMLNNDFVKEVFNCGCGIGHSVNDMIRFYEEYNNVKLDVVYTEYRRGDPLILVANNEKLHSVLGWEAKFKEKSLEEICRSSHLWELYLNSQVSATF